MPNDGSLMLSRATWIKSSRSASGDNNCVEVAVLSGNQVGIRDSKAEPGGPVLAVSRQSFRTFIHAAKSGVFDRAVEGA
jgi:Domain of unknown function (DUF397)